MNKELRLKAVSAGLPLMDFIMKRISELESETGIKRTVLAVCPNSISVIKAALKSAKRCNAPIKFATTLNQVDLDGGYTGFTPSEFINTIRLLASNLNVSSPVIVAIDHGGPWLKDIHAKEKWSYEKTNTALKESFDAAICAGYDLIHIDPTVDITLPEGSEINIEVVVERTLELIEYTEDLRLRKNLPEISYEVGTEEVHGGLADLTTFRTFLDLLKKGLLRKGLPDVWPCFVVGKVGTDLHTMAFDPVTAIQLTEIARIYGSLIKGHYTDSVVNPESYPESGMGAANIGPELTEMEFDGLIELEQIQSSLWKSGRIAKPVQMKKMLHEAVIRSGRWQKWLQPGENPDDFYSISPERQDWLVRTGCRYIWEDPVILAARYKLYQNMKLNGIQPEEIVESSIEKAIDKYFYRFNLVGLNTLL